MPFRPYGVVCRKIAWDNLFKKHDRLVVFLCGSVSTWISENILNNTGFVGRASANMVVGELPLDVCVNFWGRRASRTSIRDFADLLSVTGCVPRYLEEIDPSLSADENIRRMCFAPDAMLRTALVYEGRLAPGVEADGYFDAIVPFSRLLGL